MYIYASGRVREVEGERRDGGVLDDRLDCSHRIGPAWGVSQPEAKARSRREGEGTENRSESNSGLEREQSQLNGGVEKRGRESGSTRGREGEGKEGGCGELRRFVHRAVSSKPLPWRHVSAHACI